MRKLRGGKSEDKWKRRKSSAERKDVDSDMAVLVVWDDPCDEVIPTSGAYSCVDLASFFARSSAIPCCTHC